MLKILGIIFGVGILGAVVCAVFPSVAQLSGWYIVPVGIVAFGAWKIREGYLTAGKPAPAPQFVCAHCHSQVTPEKRTPGSFAIELVLWLCFLVPGLIYTIWRINSRFTVCPVCNAPNPIPVSSPVGQQLVART